MKKRVQAATASVLAAVMIATSLASAVTASAYTVQPPADDLVLWYDMEGSEGVQLPDRSGNGLDGVINGGALFADGIKGNAITFDGGDDYIEIPDLDGQLSQIDDFTVSVYLKVAEDRTFQRVFDFGTGETGKFMCLMTRSTNQWNSGLNYTISENGGGAAVEKSVVVKDGAPQCRWFHLALVYQQGIAKIYYDGVQQAEAEIALKPSDIAVDAEGFRSYLGKSLWDDPLFCGEMDDFRLYSRALSAEELAEVASLTDMEKVKAAKELLTLPKTAVQNLELVRTGAYGTRISWRSNRPEAITADGKVTRPDSGDVLVKLTATIQSGGASLSKDFFVTVRASLAQEQILSFDLEDVALLDGEFLEKEEINRAVMDSISADTILYAFRYNANQNYGANLDYKGAPSLHGWAEPGHQFAGHLEGHYMSALAMLYGRYHDEADKAKLDAIVDGLAEIQGLMLSDGDNPGDPKVARGYLSAFPESRFDQLESHQYAAVPWYMIHKIMAGLLDAYNYCGNEKALEVADQLAQWTKWRMERLGDRAEEVLSYEEYGGMNEVLLNMYAATGKEEYLPIAALFEERERLFDDLYNGVDNLDGMHGNTYLAKIVGLARNYQLFGDDYYRLATEHFWDFVVEDGRTYVNGGNSIAEHYQVPNTLSHQLNGDTCETCNVYNLLKISRDLFEWSGDVKYLDYYEQGLFNQILGSMNPEGDKTYFQPMGANRRATWNDTVYGAFCCNGSGLENFSKLNECLYFFSDDTLYVAQFAASTLNWEEQGVRLKQETSYPYEDTSLLTFEQADGRELTVMIRIPSWIKSGYTIELNGEEYACGTESGFVAVTGEFKTGDTIRVSLPMDFARAPMGDDDMVTAFTYGPVALAAIGSVNDNGTLAFDSQSAYENWKDNLNEWFQPAGDGLPLHFSAEDGRGNSLLFVPFTEVGDETYTTYFRAETGITADRGDNLAFGKAVKASEQYNGDYGPEKAVDGINSADVENRWCVRSDAMPQWFKIDLGAETLVTNVDFTAEKPAGFQYVVEYSNDPSDWADDSFASGNWQVFCDKSNNSQVSTEYAASGAARARYLRIRFLSSTNGVWAGMRELEVYSSTLGLLKDAIFHAERIDRDAYLSTTDWAAFDSILNEARNIAEKENPQADEILSALDQLQNAIDTLQLKADTTALRDKIEFIQQYYLQDEYTDESWTSLEEAIAQAELVCGDETASAAEIEAASQQLNQALYELAARSDRERIAAKLAQIEQLNQNDYTAESWGQLQDAVALAQQILEDESVADSEVSDALAALETAISNLVEGEIPSDVDKSMLESLIKAIDGVF
ncbi:beta-L-arabinofuranosidase domain-containing protein, partial [Ligaoa zhengdingensis]|uniref:beta-L-arabinofuranosidase domain-containing protein n=5 Tax=Ligaoa zhengdingensis TaxID=2763658 RepID=UPI0031BA2501